MQTLHGASGIARPAPAQIDQVQVPCGEARTASGYQVRAMLHCNQALPTLHPGDDRAITAGANRAIQSATTMPDDMLSRVQLAGRELGSAHRGESFARANGHAVSG